MPDLPSCLCSRLVFLVNFGATLAGAAWARVLAHHTKRLGAIMLGNTFGRIFQVTTCGESYGWHATAQAEGYGGALLAIVNGVPGGVKLDVPMLQRELDKRRPGQSKLDSPRMETDRVEVVSGLFEGVTTGAPVGMI